MTNRLFRQNESGVILVTVILLTIVLSIVVIGILSLNVGQVKSSKSVVDSVVAEQLATGLFYQKYQQKFDGTNQILPSTITVGSTVYTVNRDEAAGSSSTPNNTNQLQINLTYNSYQ